MTLKPVVEPVETTVKRQDYKNDDGKEDEESIKLGIRPHSF